MHVFDFILKFEIFVAVLWFISEVDVSFPRPEYLVDTEKCKIPNYEPFNVDTLKLWRSHPYRHCTTKPLLTYITKTEQTATLHVKEHLLPLYGNNITCCVSNVVRIAEGPFPDDNFWFTNCKGFDKHVELTSDTVIVRCNDTQGNQVYKNAHAVILNTPKIKARIRSITRNTKPVSVLFIVVDSVSRLNLVRTMPETRDYLLENEFIEMEGYSKIDDNTFPNFMALLNGLNSRQIGKINCTGRRVNDLDQCPMIWNDFKNSGYATAYGEDWGPLGTFNYMKKGFTNPPTDYYFRPYVIASEKLGTILLNNAPYCTGPETSGERQLKLALDFSRTFKNSPYFGIFWMNTFSHQAINTPSRFDDKLRTFFINLKAEGVLDDSIVIFLSDHGIRIDPGIRKTIPGWFEERLPMNLISVPKWFQLKYPKEYRNLKLNSKKLTTTLDLHMTLQHVLKLSSPTYKVTQSKACPNCVSLFEEVTTRTCSEAGIPLEWCPCVGYLTPLNNSSDLVMKGVQFVLNYMQSLLDLFKLNDLCYDLELLSVKTAGLSEIGRDKILFLNFITRPFADFIVTLHYETNGTDSVFRTLHRIVRLDTVYTRCLNYSSVSPYCNCKEKVVNEGM